jgi:hypothetical protein
MAPSTLATSKNGSSPFRPWESFKLSARNRERGTQEYGSWGGLLGDLYLTRKQGQNTMVGTVENTNHGDRMPPRIRSA